MNEWTCDECRFKETSVDKFPCDACYDGSLYESKEYEPKEGSENHDD